MNEVPCVAAPARVAGDARRDPPPLAVDLDGTLAMADTLHEGLVDYLHQRPLELGGLLAQMRRGKAAFKRLISGEHRFDPATLPYNQELLAWLRTEQAAGRRLGLFTAADQRVAQAVADHLGLFEVVRGSDGATNLSGHAKAEAIRETFGDRFAYAGDSTADRPIFARAAQVVLVGPAATLGRVPPAGWQVEAVFPTPKPGPAVWARALRLHHWPKNMLVFAAPVVGMHLTAGVLASALLLFILLGMLASATYLLNDLVDLPADRRHPVKRLRPLAAGKLSTRQAVLAGLALGGGAIGLGVLSLPALAALVLPGYLGLTLAYSFVLKREPFLDVTVLAGLFTLRVLAGNLLVPGPVSPWLLTFSMLLFLGLAMVKRYAELDRVVASGGAAVVSRGYTARDLPLLLAAGLAAGFAAIVILMLYLIIDQAPRGIYGHPGALWAILPLVLLWKLRVWHLTVHGRMNEDPVLFALKDRTSLFYAGSVAVVLMLAWA